MKQAISVANKIIEKRKISIKNNKPLNASTKNLMKTSLII